MSAQRAQAARVTAIAAVLACLITLVVPLSSAQAAATHRPAGTVAAAALAGSGTGTVLGNTLDAAAAFGHDTHVLAARETAGAAIAPRTGQHAHESTAPRGPPGRRT
jgi:negative regulator of sigma E activity